MSKTKKQRIKYRICKWLYMHGHERLSVKISPSITGKIRGEVLGDAIIAGIDSTRQAVYEVGAMAENAAAHFRALALEIRQDPNRLLSSMWPEAEHDRD